jgi:DNA-binding transcriptional ArsR family regulator
MDIYHPSKANSPRRLTSADEMLTLLPMTTNRTIKDALYEQVARIAKAAASPKRLELIELLGQSPKTVEALAQEAGISAKLVSAHLKELKSARLVEAERQGKYIIYRLASTEVGQLWVTLRVLAEDRLFELQDALRQLSAATHEWVGNSREELLTKAKSGEVIVIDVRPGEEYQAGHLPFARSMPLAELKNRLAELPTDRPVIAYCRGPFCLMSTDAVKLLRGQGIDALQMREGVVEWNS